jgi:two-component system response regulator ChvI
LCPGCPWRAGKRHGQVLDTATRRAYWQGHDVGLTSGEYRLLARLLESAGQFVSYRTLYDALCGRPGFHAGQDGQGFRTNVRSIIKRIRHKVLVVDPAFAAIENYQGFGYRWREPAALPSVVVAVPPAALLKREDDDEHRGL